MVRLASNEETAAVSRRTDLRLTAAVLSLLLIAALALVVTGTTAQLLGWAWKRHANILSWYIRPLFLLPLAYFSYKRCISGIVLTLIALATSMAWFPAPEHVRPEVADFLAFERDWLTSGWTPGKVLSWTVALAGLATVCLAFWRRSLAYGLVVITALAVGKIAWGVVEGRGTGWAMLLPAIAGLVVCSGGVLYAMRWRGRRSSHGSSRHPRMRRVMLTPVVILIAAAVAVGVAFVLDTGGGAQRDAALLLGTAGVWGLAVGTLWLIAALGYLGLQRRRLPRS